MFFSYNTYKKKRENDNNNSIESINDEKINEIEELLSKQKDLEGSKNEIDNNEFTDEIFNKNFLETENKNITKKEDDFLQKDILTEINKNKLFNKSKDSSL